jgi:hypothetical protein
MNWGVVTMGTFSVWADISLLWLIGLALITILPLAVLFFFCIRGMIWLRHQAIVYLPLVADRLRLVADTSETISQKVATPIIQVEAKAAQVHGVTKAIFSRRNGA